MGKEGKHGTMAVILMVIGSLMLLKGVELINGPIKEYTLVNGKTINYMEAESLTGLTVVLTPENIWMTSNLAMEPTNGLMVNHTRDNGLMGSSMEREYSLILKEVAEKEGGKTEKGSNGLALLITYEKMN